MASPTTTRSGGGITKRESGSRSARSIAGNLWLDYLLTLPEVPIGAVINADRWIVHAIDQHDEACALSPCNCAWRKSWRVQRRYVQAP